MAAVCLVTTALAASDRVLCSLGTSTSSYNAYSDERPSADAMQLASPVNAALAAVCTPRCPRISLFRNTTAPNVILIATTDQMKIVYNPEFFTKVYDAYGDAAIQAIFAHEVGHAIDAIAPAPWMKSNWTPELRADAWAGCALAKLHPRARSLQEAFMALSKYPSASHPDWAVRLPVLTLGFTQCGGNAADVR
jgi:hypothetical protein